MYFNSMYSSFWQQCQWTATVLLPRASIGIENDFLREILEVQHASYSKMSDKDIFWNFFSNDIGRWPGDILSSGHTHSIETFSWEDLRSHLSIVSFIYFIIFYFIIIYLFIYNRLNLPLPREGWWNTSTASTSIWRRRRGCSSKTCYRSSIWCHPKIGRFLRGKN